MSESQAEHFKEARGFPGREDNGSSIRGGAFEMGQFSLPAQDAESPAKGGPLVWLYLSLFTRARYNYSMLLWSGHFHAPLCRRGKRRAFNPGFWELLGSLPAPLKAVSTRA